MRRISGREFNQDVGKAKRAAQKGPVIITDRGRPAYVLLRHEAYQRLTDGAPTILDLLADRKSANIEFQAPKLGAEPVRVDRH